MCFLCPEIKITTSFYEWAWSNLSLLHPLWMLSLWHALRPLSWVFISGLGFVDSIARLLKINCDNSLVVILSNYDKYYKCVKHMEIKYLLLKRSSETETVNWAKLPIKHISTNLMIVNSSTKWLSLKAFNEHSERWVLLDVVIDIVL